MNVDELMRNRTRVRAVYASGPGTHAEGCIIGYQERPSVIIETDTGERVSWAAHLIERIAGGAADDPVGTVRCSHAPCYLAVTAPGVMKHRWVEIGTGNRLSDSEAAEIPRAAREVLDRFFAPQPAPEEQQ